LRPPLCPRRCWRPWSFRRRQRLSLQARRSPPSTYRSTTTEPAIRLHPGQRFLLALGEGYEWTVTVADPAIVSRVINVLVMRGAQGLYEAHGPGATTLQASGDPTCRSAQPPCGAPSRLFGISIIVTPG
jgi:hypothetical protein